MIDIIGVGDIFNVVFVVVFVEGMGFEKGI